MLNKVFDYGKRFVPVNYRIRLLRIYTNAINLLKYQTIDMFDLVLIETRSECNRKCWYCPNSKYSRPNGILSVKTFKNIINQLSDIKYSLVLGLHFFNEPLLDKRLPDLVEYARKKLPNIKIKISTNGDFLTKKLYAKLINCGVDEFFITNHTLNQFKELEQLDKVVIYKLQKESLMNQGGLINGNFQKQVRCKMKHLVINYEGKTALCCKDYFAKHSFGNVNETKIMDIWNDIAYKLIRKHIREGRHDYDMCKKCMMIYEGAKV